MIYYDLPTLRIKVELTGGENDPLLFLTIKLFFSVDKVRQSMHSIDILHIENKLVRSHVDYGNYFWKHWIYSIKKLTNDLTQ